MGNLIELDDSQLELQNAVPASCKLFGVIKRECNAIDVTKLDESSVEKLKLGTLIQIMPDYHGDHCHFKIRDFDNWCDKYKTTIYKCSKDDYIVVNSELWPYLMALKNYEGRIKFVNSVYHREFDMNMLKVGREIRIRGPHNAEINYFEFLVKYIGVVKAIGTGYYIALQLKNSDIPLTSELKCLSRYYELEGVGIIVPADWIMLNLYNEEEFQSKPIFKTNHDSCYMDKTSVEYGVEVTENNLDLEKFCRPIEKSRVISEMFIPEIQCGSSQNQFDSTYVKQNFMNSFEIIENRLEKNDLSTSMERTNQLTSDTDAISKNRQLSATKYPEDYKNQSNFTVEIENVNNVKGSVKNTDNTECGLCREIVKIGIGVILRECLHSFCEQCIRYYVKRNVQYSGGIRCPYNKEYKCEFNLLDDEIKDLGGERIYNEILENRLKEYVGTDSNARRCSNQNCREVWIISQDIHANFDKCPKCGESWCNMCKFPHEPKEPHGRKSDKSIEQRVKEFCNKTIFGREPAEPNSDCVKCHKINIRKSECVTLRNCNHTFCKDCVMPMIKTQTSGSQYANCVICKKRLDDEEVIKITGFNVLNLFLDSRKEPSAHTNIQIENCICLTSTTNLPTFTCNFVLGCGHQFCQTFITIYIQQQLTNSVPATCPKCSVKIDHFVLNLLLNPHVVDKCQMCFKPSDVQLEKCRHSFCYKCIGNLISNQVLDSTKMCINCMACGDTIVDSDIARYGGEEIVALLKPQFEATTEMVSKPIDHITLNDSPFNCLSCDARISVNQGVVFRGCQDSFCLECCKEFIGKQLALLQTPKCVFCLKDLEQFEVDEIIETTSSVVNSSQILVECLKCEEKFEESLIHKCSKCANPICLKCAHSTISGQITNNRPPNCLFCQMLLEVSLIASILNSCTLQPESQSSDIFQMIDKPERMLNQYQLNSSGPVNISFECAVCDQSTDEACQIQLTKCKHEICRNCLQEIISIQMKLSDEPKCPICRENVEISELDKFGISSNSQAVTESIQHTENFENTHNPIFGKSDEFPRIVELNSFSKLNTSLLVNNVAFECTMCDNKIDSECGVILTNCGHCLCRNCISDVILQQSGKKIKPACPLCQTLITGDEFRILDPGVHNVFLENQLDHDSSAKLDEFVNLIQDEVVHGFDEMYVCVICEETFVPQATKVLTLCSDRFCRPCIIQALQDQSSINKIPKCPLCTQEVAGADIIDLCGMDVFKRYMGNKRNK